MVSPVFTSTLATSETITGPVSVDISTTEIYGRNNTDAFISDPATVTVTEGQPPFTYQWNSSVGMSPDSSTNATTTYVISQLDDGENPRIIQCTVTDARGEQAVAQAFISVFVFSGNTITP